MKTVYEKFGLEPGTQDFIGHAMALYLDDELVGVVFHLIHYIELCCQLHRQARSANIRPNYSLYSVNGPLWKIAIHLPTIRSG